MRKPLDDADDQTSDAMVTRSTRPAEWLTAALALKALDLPKSTYWRWSVDSPKVAVRASPRSLRTCGSQNWMGFGVRCRRKPTVQRCQRDTGAQGQFEIKSVVHRYSACSRQGKRSLEVWCRVGADG